ncbi:MAG: phosphoribosylaminoimidazolesuccinocarboxamide synthase [Acidimicrobiia bacterium]|nr:phosphoribosylaminoimidazolesuccinocarboxamide synthase [Acidimicrobiia bacterium]NNC42817.1 phosphoribosylaminoimidazolesuccinocarboxamide synthase [Acidimicrobiia bacterium]
MLAPQLNDNLIHVASGKVRDIYQFDDDHLVMVTSDRISAFDVVMGQPIPDKGRVLTGLSVFWFSRLPVANHLESVDPWDIPAMDERSAEQLAGRTMITRKAEVIPMECVVRGYLYGSSWKEYESGGGPTTEHLPDGLMLASKLETPLFTPATKAETGHDENLTEAGARELVGDDLYDELRARSLAIYQAGRDYAAERGIILADTKFEFGFVDGELTLIDEVLTPDSSRYWPANAWAEGATMPSFDKQFLRDWLETQSWDKTSPAPTLPGEIVTGTRSRYVEAYELLTGESFDTYLKDSGVTR